MGGVSVKREEETSDLLTLISRSIDELRLSIGLLEAADRVNGLEHLATVVQSIDSYLARIDSDPLLRLAPIPTGNVRAGLDSIRSDLNVVIRGLSTRPL